MEGGVVAGCWWTHISWWAYRSFGAAMTGFCIETWCVAEGTWDKGPGAPPSRWLAHLPYYSTDVLGVEGAIYGAVALPLSNRAFIPA